ncbi:hypothetical protein KALB_460 [Kutzneria albida DSM 43870]|uniref:Uncharacterized protein n=1 Tax=Kutzneria albida DSM 43870 TaxID=1449976 RepID=W5VZX6_9PSEU|nr:hypothetical protein KALB_460 [Kutzneria albida DSM 43870]
MVNPCKLFSDADLKQLGITGQPTTAGQDCLWVLSGGVAVNIGLHEGTAVDGLHLPGASDPSKATVGSRSAVKIVNEKTNMCAYGLALPQNSSVTVIVASIPGRASACDSAEQVAKIIEPKLPSA